MPATYFARGELIDVDALSALYANEEFYGTYVADFPDKRLQGNPRVLAMPHLGASTPGEAEERGGRGDAACQNWP